MPPSLVQAEFKKQQKNPGVTEFQSIANRGHSLTIDDGWRDVADLSLAFIQRFVQPRAATERERADTTA